MNVKNLVLGIGIFIVYLLVLNYGIKAFYPEPKNEDFCKSQNYYYPGSYPVKEVTSGVNCSISPTPQQQDVCMAAGGNLVADGYDSNQCPASFKCDTCGKEFNEKQKNYAQTVFIIALVVGILTLIAGYFFLVVEPIGSSLMASGVGALVYGSINNWMNLSNIWRFLLLLIALALLIWITLRINYGKKKKK